MTVYLVGAGPGDPGLITVRGAEVLAEADVVVHDRLAHSALLDLAPAEAERVDVGKSPGAPVAQGDINALLIHRARQGLRVVRLKGGDPFVFGRGGEEVAALAEAGIAFEVVPGISAALAVPAYAGIPVTHRGVSTSVTVVTGHSRHSLDEDTDWSALARAGDTIVVLMGVAHRGQIAERLMAGGLAASTPVAAIRWGTRPEQRTVRTTLCELSGVDLEPPVTMVIGGVAALDFGWFERRPLFGQRIVVTRSRRQAPGLRDRLNALGAETIEVPTIEIVDPADGGEALGKGARGARTGSFDWICFTSVNAVERFFVCIRDARDLGRVLVAAVGRATADALAQRGVVADLVPPAGLAEAMVADFPRGPGTVLLPQAAAARVVLAEGLRSKGWDVTVAEAYRTVGVTPPAEVLARIRLADAVAFSSSSTVSSYLAAAGIGAVPKVVVCIGPVTAATARGEGLDVAAVATEHTVDGLVATLVDVLGGRRPAPAPNAPQMVGQGSESNRP